MINFEDTRITFRVDPELKKWVDSRGASKFLRRLLLKAYEQLEGKQFSPQNELKGT